MEHFEALNHIMLQTKAIGKVGLNRGRSSSEILDLLEDALARLIADPSGQLTTELLQEHFNTGGKRLRGLLTIEACLLQGVKLEQAIPLGAAVELLHNASLIHDDIQDGDTHRRGQLALWKAHGLPQAINVGDYAMLLFNKAIEAIPQISDAQRWQLSMAFSRHAYETIHGQVREIAFPDEKCWSWDAYITIVGQKTGALFALPIECSALLAGEPSEYAQKLGKAFVDLGILFQLQDDVLDLYGSKGRDKRGSDLYEGKISGIVVTYLEMYPEDKQRLKALLKAPRGQSRAEEVAHWIQRFRTGGALGEVLATIGRMTKAIESNEVLRAHPELANLAMGLVEQLLLPIADVMPKKS